MDATTYGDTGAARVLIDKLAKLGDPKLCKRVRRYMSNTLTGFARLNEIEDDKWFKLFAVRWRNERIGMIAFHPEIDTYLENIVRTTFKQYVRGYK